jgi:hypothetical protein
MLIALLALTASTVDGAMLPFPEELLRGETRKSLREVVEKPTLHRQLSGLRLAGRRAVFEHLATHPDFAASLARVAGALKYTVTRQGPGRYWADDHRGLTGHLEILQIAEGQLVIFAEGTYRKGILRIPGRFAVVLRSAEGRDDRALHPDYVENTISAYVRLDGEVLDPVARLFRPLVDGILQKRIEAFFKKANRLMTRLSEEPEVLLQQLPPDGWQEETSRLRTLLNAPGGAGVTDSSIPTPPSLPTDSEK